MKKRCELEGDGQLWPMFLEVHGALVDLIEKDLLRAGGPPLTWYDVLAQLNLAEDSMLPMNQLADSVLLSRSGVTRLVDRMAQEGLVERAQCDTDRRVVYARLTQKGREVFERSMPVVRGGVTEYFTGHLNARELATLRTVLLKVIDRAEAPAQAV
jgi:DNA-binding MarR family transcriptional regulator